MATTHNLKGTSYSSFQVGKGGPTILQGTAAPSGGSDGDLYIRTGGTNKFYQKISSSWTELGSGGSAYDDTAVKSNVVLNAFRIAINGGLSVQNMVDGVVDEFEDETGVDTGTSTNESYDSTDDYYNNTSSYDGSWDYPDNSAVNCNLTYRGQRFRCNSTDTVSQATINMNAVGTATNISMEIWTDNSGSPGTKVGSTSGSISAAVGDNTCTWSSGNPSLTSGTLYWLVVAFSVTSVSNLITTKTESDSDLITGSHGTITSITDGSGSAGGCVSARIQYSAGTQNMTLVSNSSTASATPTDAIIILWEEDVDSITLNTDIKAYVSRDGGTTFTQATLAEETSLSTGRVLTGTVDISGQPSGTSMKWKIETLNNKGLKLHGVGLEWS